MAKFCSQCGRPLQDGEICTCQSQKKENAQEPAQSQPVTEEQSPAPEPGQETAEDAGVKTAQDQPRGGAYGQGNLYGQPQGGAYGQGNPYGQPQGGAYGQGNPYGQPQGGAYGQGNPYSQPQGGAYGQGNPYGQPQGGAYGQGNPYGQPQGGAYGQGNPYGQPQGGAYGQGNPYGQPQGGAYGQPKKSGAAGEYFKDLWGTIVNAYKKPAGTLSNLAVSGKASVSLGICAIQVLLFSFIFLFLGVKINSLVSFSGYKIVSTPLFFFIAILAGAAILAVWAAFAMVFARTMAKKEMTYTQGLGVAAAKAIAQMPFTALTALFILIFPIISQFTLVLTALFYQAGALLCYFFIPASMNAFSADDKNKKIWQLFVTFLVNLLAGMIISWIYMQIVGGSLTSALSTMLSGLM